MVVLMSYDSWNGIGIDKEAAVGFENAGRITAAVTLCTVAGEGG